jgi:RecA-family ATPase
MTSELLPELQQFKLPGREIAVAYDSDIVIKPRVEAAERRFVKELTARGAIVRPVRLPPSETGGKVGLDDYLLEYSIDDLFDLVSRSAPAKGSYTLPVALADLMARDYPLTEWVWDGFILNGEVNLLFGDGGIGKSLLALHLAVATAAGKPLLGKDTIPMPVLGLFSEDGEAQTQERVATILAGFGLTEQPNLPVKLWCQPAEDTQLASINEKGKITELPRLHALRAELAKIGRPTLLILDSFADLFILDESQRLPVNAALKRVLGGLCRDFGATVLVLAHPSKASIQDGSKYSGSTAFNNAVRQRLTLEFAKLERDTAIDGPPPRILRVAKSNYGAGTEMTLWFYGCSIQGFPRGPALSAEAQRELVLTTMLRLIDTGVRVVKSNGDGQKPKDVATDIREKRGVSLATAQIRQHLDALERDGLLAYRQADKNNKVAKAQYVRGPLCNK